MSGIVRVFRFLIGTLEFPRFGRAASGVWDVFRHVLGGRAAHVLVPVAMPGNAGGHRVELLLVAAVADMEPEGGAGGQG